jgi:type I restriction enzyme R subunit
MPTTDISEKGLETLIMLHMTGTDGLARVPEGAADTWAETPDAISAAKAAGSGWLAGSPRNYDRTHALDVPQLFQFLHATQPEALKKLGIVDYKDVKDITRQKFLARLTNEIGKRGVIDVLRKGIEHHPVGHFDLFYGTPSPGNATSAAFFAKNRFSVTRQLRYSQDETRRALDLCLFINGHSPRLS